MKWLLIPAVLIAAWFAPGDSGDILLDWTTARAVIEGDDPYQPVSELDAEFGIEVDLPHPRLPGALLVQAPLGFIPADIIGQVGKVLVAACLIGAWFLIRPGWWTILFLYPALNAVWYANLSAAVTLLVAVALIRHSGAALGVATILRGWPWFLGLAFLAVGRWKPAVVSGAVFFGVNAAGLLLPAVTFDGAVEAFRASLDHAGNPANLAVPLWVGLLLAVGFLAALVKDRGVFGFAVIPALALSPVIWLHYLTVMAVPLGERPTDRGSSPRREADRQ